MSLRLTRTTPPRGAMRTVWRTSASLIFLLLLVMARCPLAGGVPWTTSEEEEVEREEVVRPEEVITPDVIRPEEVEGTEEMAPDEVAPAEVAPADMASPEAPEKGAAEEVEREEENVIRPQEVEGEHMERPMYVKSPEEVAPDEVAPAVTIIATTTTTTAAPTRSPSPITTTSNKSPTTGAPGQENPRYNRMTLFVSIGIVAGAIIVIFFICVVELCIDHQGKEQRSSRCDSSLRSKRGYTQLPTSHGKTKEIKPLLPAKLGNPVYSHEEDDEEEQEVEQEVEVYSSGKAADGSKPGEP